MTSPIKYYNVFQQLLGDLFSVQELRQAVEDTEDLIRYSLERFGTELITAGYSSEYAITTATQIIPKPFLYSALIAYRVAEQPSEMLKLYGQASAWDEGEFRNIQYSLIAPVIMVYLFDQTIDNYNGSAGETTLITDEIDKAATRLIEDPRYYHNRLMEIIAFTKSCDCFEYEMLPAELRPYWLFALYSRSALHTPIDEQEIIDVAYTTADVISYEHIGALAYNAGAFSEAAFPVVTDFIDLAMGRHHSYLETSIKASARAGLRNQGFMLITTLLYIQMRIFFNRYRLEGDKLSLQHFIQSGLVPYLRIYEIIVRIGDDLGDYHLDKEHGALNFLVRGDDLLDDVLRLSGLYETDAVNSRMVEEFINLLRNANLENEQEAYFDATIEAMYHLREHLSCSAIAHIDALPSEAFDAEIKKQYRFIVRIIDEIIEGAIVNTTFNDRSAEKLGRLIRSAA